MLANLFLHYVFDVWMRRSYPHIPFERYADDAICHCRTRQEAEELKSALERRFADCHLMLHPEKTKVVYCADSNRRRSHPQIHFDFLGFSFRPRLAKNRWGRIFTCFLPGGESEISKGDEGSHSRMALASALAASARRHRA
jgi:hypothetical protein